MTRRLLLGYLALTVFVLLMLEIPLGITFARRERDALVADVRRDAESIARFATGPLRGGAGDLQAVADAYRDRTSGRLVVTDADGIAVADSDAPAGRSFASRPEIGRALAGEESSGFRTSETLGERLLFVAVPVDPSGEVVGTARVTYPATVVDERIRRTWLVLGGVGLLAVGAVAVLGSGLAASLARPVREIESAARRLGRGELDARAPVPRGPAELRRLASELNAAGGELERLVASQRGFVADASHQLRTPLSALRLRLEILETDVPDALADDVAAALTEVHRLSRLVDGLLTLARAEQAVARPEPVRLTDIVRSRTEAWSPVASERGVDIVTRVDDHVVVEATPGHLEQVLDNLVSNAIEVSPDGGRVSVTERHDDDWVNVHVVDDGPGMAPDRRARAFDRFWRGDGNRGDGFGLGLAIVRHLVVADGGGIDLLEAPTGGLDAHVRLRRVVPDGDRTDDT